MAIKVLLFASLRERFGKAEVHLESEQPLPIAEVWQRSTGQAVMPDNTLVAINHAYADSHALVQPDDEVAFFPPVTGG